MIEWHFLANCVAETYFGTGGFYISKNCHVKYTLERCTLFSHPPSDGDIDFHLVGQFDSIDDAKAAAELIC